MKTTLFICFALINLSIANAQCENYQSSIQNAESYASSAYSYAKKTYNEDNLEDSQYYAKKAMNFEK